MVVGLYDGNIAIYNLQVVMIWYYEHIDDDEDDDYDNRIDQTMTDTEVIKNYRRTLGSQPTSRMQEMGSTKILFGRSVLLIMMMKTMMMIMIKKIMMVMLMLMDE